ncbi:hypothetical protein M91_02331, partial [Bos mutus]
MTRGNQSHITEFLLLGLSSDPKQQVWLFASFLVMYLVNVGGNSVIIAAIQGDVRLHTPMYFFLSNLSFVDICFTNVIVPRMLANMQSKSKKVPFTQCLTQMYFFVACAITDSFLLAAMALDRYVAICHPLRYTTTMNPRCCLQLVTASWLVSHLHSLTHTILMARLSFCGPNIIHHFFCDVQPLLMLSCSDTSLNELLAFTEGSFVIMTMTRGNQSHITEFLLLGLSSDPKQQVWLFASFLVMYLVNVGGNSVIIAAIQGDVRLHTPMYFFLSNLSFVDICFTNVIVPRMLANMQSKSKKVPFTQCLTQMYFFVACAITDSFLL